MDLRMELSSSRWRRWRDYIASGRSEKVIDEFEKYSKIRDVCFGDLKLRDEALKNMGVLKLPLGKNREKY